MLGLPSNLNTQYFQIEVSGLEAKRKLTKMRQNISSVEVCAALCTLTRCQLFVYQINQLECHMGQLKPNSTDQTTLSINESFIVNINIGKYLCLRLLKFTIYNRMIF
jgi:hypothetical protein